MLSALVGAFCGAEAEAAVLRASAEALAEVAAAEAAEAAEAEAAGAARAGAECPGARPVENGAVGDAGREGVRLRVSA